MKKGDNHKLMHPDMGKLAKQYSPLPGSPGDTMDPKNATSQSPIGSVQAPSIYNDHHQNYSQMNIVDVAKVSPSGTGNTPMGRGLNTGTVGFAQSPTQLAPAPQLEMAQYNSGPGTQNKVQSPMGPTGMPAPILGNMAMMEGTNQPANKLGFSGVPQPSGTTPTKVARTKRQGGKA
tara:strand:+ start:2237 stop:2764 length:528 start_codon:yes stop_codon:yes gene_type:complete